MSTLNTRKIKHDSSAVDNITLDSSGRVCVGSQDLSAFGRKFLVDGTGGFNNSSGTVGVGFSRGASSTYGYIGTGDWAVNGLSTTDFGISSGATGALVLGTGAGSERVRIDNSGRVTMPYQPAFRAGFSGAPTKNSGDILTFDSVYVNRGSCYNSSNGRFTAPTYGLYFFSFVDNLNRDTASWAGIYWRKNGSNVGLIYDDTSSAWVNVSGTIILELNAGDYVDLIAGGGGTTQFDSVNYGGVMGYLLG